MRWTTSFPCTADPKWRGPSRQRVCPTPNDHVHHPRRGIMRRRGLVMTPAAWWWPGRARPLRGRHHSPYGDGGSPDRARPGRAPPLVRHVARRGGTHWLISHRPDPTTAPSPVLGVSPALAVSVEEHPEGRPAMHVHADGGASGWPGWPAPSASSPAIAALGAEMGCSPAWSSARASACARTGHHQAARVITRRGRLVVPPRGW
jgi:hypothetical protein